MIGEVTVTGSGTLTTLAPVKPPITVVTSDAGDGKVLSCYRGKTFALVPESRVLKTTKAGEESTWDTYTTTLKNGKKVGVTCFSEGGFWLFHKEGVFKANWVRVEVVG